MANAFLFPGHGSEQPGMGKVLYDKSEAARKLYQLADKITGVNLTETCFSVDEKLVFRPLIAFPAIFLNSLAHYLVLTKEQGIRSGAVAGYGIGEYAALVASRYFDFPTGLLRVIELATWVEKMPSYLRTVIQVDNTPANLVIKTIISADPKVADIAAVNRPDQVVLVTAEDCIDEVKQLLIEAAEKNKAKEPQFDCWENDKGICYHSSGYYGAMQHFNAFSNRYNSAIPSLPFFSCITAEKTDDKMTIASNLHNLIKKPILWSGVIRNMARAGYGNFYALEPSDFLTSLMGEKLRERMEKNV